MSVFSYGIHPINKPRHGLGRYDGVKANICLAKVPHNDFIEDETTVKRR